jgi:hypothetical protein
VHSFFFSHVQQTTLIALHTLAKTWEKNDRREREKEREIYEENEENEGEKRTIFLNDIK